MELNTKTVHFQLKDNLLICTYKTGVNIDIHTAQQIVRDRIHFLDGRKKSVLIIGNGVVTMDKAARMYLSSEEGTKGLHAAAILVNRVFSCFLGNFFIAVNKTNFPVRIFSKQETAEKWLMRFTASK